MLVDRAGCLCFSLVCVHASVLVDHVGWLCFSLVCLREELMVATRQGLLQRIRWDGVVNADMNIQLNSIPFSADLQHSRGD